MGYKIKLLILAVVTQESQRAVGFLQQFSELRLITCRKTDKASSTLIPDSTAMINNLNLFTLASVSPHFHVNGSAPCVSLSVFESNNL